MHKTWNVKIYKVLYYAILECLWCLPFGAKIVLTITWRMAFLTWIKPRETRILWLKKLEILNIKSY